MLAVVPSKWGWVREHPLEVLIVLLTSPFLTSVIQSVRVLRILRLFRLLRLAPLVRVLFSAEGVRFAGLLALLTALGGGLGFASVENIPVGDGLYWAITTMTTVGYGDLTPKTPEGKAIAVTVMLIGIGFATLVIGSMAERFIRRDVEEVEVNEDNILEQVRDISARLQRLERALEQTGTARVGQPGTSAARRSPF